MKANKEQRKGREWESGRKRKALAVVCEAFPFRPLFGGTAQMAAAKLPASPRGKPKRRMSNLLNEFDSFQFLDSSSTPSPPARGDSSRSTRVRASSEVLAHTYH